MEHLIVGDKKFIPYLDEATIHARVAALAREIEHDFQHKNPLMLCVLKGAFVFTADLVRHFNFQPEVAFTRLKSYEGTTSSGTVNNLMGVTADITGRHVIIIEDIIDTGTSMHEFLPGLHARKPASVSLASLLSKPDARVHDITIDYTGFEIPDKFVVGYGLDYDEAGRNLRSIYTLTE